MFDGKMKEHRACWYFYRTIIGGMGAVRAEDSINASGFEDFFITPHDLKRTSSSPKLMHVTEGSVSLPIERTEAGLT